MKTFEVLPALVDSAYIEELYEAAEAADLPVALFVSHAIFSYAKRQLPSATLFVGWNNRALHTYPDGAEVAAAASVLLERGALVAPFGSNESIYRLLSFSPKFKSEDRVMTPGYYDDPMTVFCKGSQVWNAALYSAYHDEEPLGLSIEYAIHDALSGGGRPETAQPVSSLEAAALESAKFGQATVRIMVYLESL
jgi:hypothetical protein